MGIGRHRRTARVRTGLLGATAALTLGVVAVTSGVLPDTDEGTTVESRDASNQAPTGGAPLDQESEDASASDRPSTTPSASRSASTQGDGPSDKPSGRATDRTDAATGNPSGTPKGDGNTGTENAPSQDKSRSAESGPGSGDGGTGEESAAEAAVLKLVNEERARQGCRPVAHDARLAEFAGKYSVAMAEGGFFSHTTPDGRSPWDRAEEAGIDNLAAENIARGQADAEAVMAGWMDSPGHRANILNCDYRTMGVGAHFADGGPWWTQNFGR
ncbi:CAP domain-containing protein [Streptomyces oceani]|uniref:SCP domain-containing protein n=1 Tax=Streptomyces oceani TaxID=1075402 RepID=A0A1E7JRM0_9ACTN|nr:CAP domain-containing protein [Streptomyces oceani]OEU91420.1 hypothetical protein AN216_25150 [Streptomyces oceani]